MYRFSNLMCVTGYNFNLVIEYFVYLGICEYRKGSAIAVNIKAKHLMKQFAAY